MRRIRPPAVAGIFYPEEAGTLRAQVDAFISAAHPADGPPPKALVAPHAGYAYSGAIAGAAYAALPPSTRRVVLLGPAHYVPMNGLVLPDAEAMRTPLGDVPLDEEACAALPVVRPDARVHEREHSLEVHLPFLQRRLAGLSLVPLAVGTASPDEVAEVLEAAWDGPETVVIVSTDLSHYLPYREAQARDLRTALRIEALEPVDEDDACGAAPLNGLLLVARARKLRVRFLDDRVAASGAHLPPRNSGDTAGDRSRVVGYGAFAFAEAA